LTRQEAWVELADRDAVTGCSPDRIESIGAQEGARREVRVDGEYVG